MNSQIEQIKNQILGMALFIILFVLDHYGVPIWFSVPAFGISSVGVLYAVLRRRDAKQKAEQQS